jgi:hypothetical protein
VTPASVLPLGWKTPGKFGRIFGTVLGGALNMVLPGAGSIISSFIGKGNLGGFNPDFVAMEGMIAESARMQMQMVMLQSKVQNQSLEFSSVSNMLKARHDTEMTAVQNFKS